MPNRSATTPAFRRAMLAAAFTLPASALTAFADDGPPRALVENKTQPTACAEFDNVYFTLTNPAVRGFEIEATPPVYLPDLKTDSTGPDFANCEAMKDDPKHTFTPRQVTLYESETIRIVGHTYGESWRPHGADVVVGDRTESDLHLVQLFEKIGGAFVEYLVVYPFDGYWRARPIPTARFPEAAYGTSFLVGPIEEQHRPIVDIERIEIDPVARVFRLRFARGGRAELSVVAADESRARIKVALEDLPADAHPFAGIRSMFVTPTNADTARAVWKMDGGYYTKPVMEFATASTSEIRFDRIELSRHNTSAPDVTFRDFTDGRAP